MSILILLTGGTFDKEYNELKAELSFKSTHVDEMLRVSRFTGSANIKQLLMKDSLDITQSDRNLIADACKSAQEKQIVITHGTDMMVETALNILKADISDKVIVLTGAMVPYSFGIKSDAMFNLGNAVAFVQVLKPGVYIAMNGQYFEADNVKKDKIVGRFIKK